MIHIHVNLPREEGARRRVDEEDAVQEVEGGHDQEVVLAVFNAINSGVDWLV